MQLTLAKWIRIEQSPAKTILIDDHHGEFYECSETALLLIKMIGM